jgi:hypothetical protein
MNFENIVFQGGGVKGISYSGVIKAMNDLDQSLKFKKVVGTSVGGICAFLFSIRPSNNEVDKWMNIVVDKILKLTKDPLEEINNEIHGYGIYDNDCIRQVIEDIEKEKFNTNNLTFGDLFKLTNVELTIIGTCLSNRKAYYFNYINNPNMLVSLAVQISSALPEFYKYVEYDNKFWCDGGVCDNFAINYFDSNGLYNPQTLGMMLICDDDLPICHKISSHKQYIVDIISTSMLSQVEHTIGDKNKRNIITIDTGKISTTDFKISKEERKMLGSIGYDTVIDYFKPVSNKTHLTKVIDSIKNETGDGEIKNSIAKKSVWNMFGYL